ncbi:hypothetical protein Tco_1115795, partial [Tanacetum coccineum]
MLDAAVDRMWRGVLKEVGLQTTEAAAAEVCAEERIAVGPTNGYRYL